MVAYAVLTGFSSVIAKARSRLQMSRPLVVLDLHRRDTGGSSAELLRGQVH